MDDMVFIAIGAMAGFVIWVCVAYEFWHIAAMKGHNKVRYFLWTLLLGPVGMLMVIALPQVVEMPATESTMPDELPDI